MAEENFNQQNRINELIAELSECREDERSAQSQIIEVISATGTILGILLGASYLNENSKDAPIMVIQNVTLCEASWLTKIVSFINKNVSYARLIFWLSLLIFCTAFAYIIVIGISNVLRYYYIQNLEERLHTLINGLTDDDGRGDLLHWNAFSAPINTRNWKHVTTTHTVLSYLAFTLAVACAILFSMGMVITLFFEIEPRERFDDWLLGIVIVGMVTAFILFFRLTANAKDVAQFAWDTAHENQKIRFKKSETKLYGRTEAFRRMWKYMLYPKTQDPQKTALIVLGFIYGAILVGSAWEQAYIYKLLIALFVFDFLAYQARYQINDIRGLDEDKEMGKKNRLFSDEFISAGRLIKISANTASVKIILAILISLMLKGNLRVLLLWSLVLLLLSTILYEFARKSQKTWLVFFLVGMGYPLRFGLGLFIIMPLSWEWLLHGQMVCFLSALWAYGSFSSVLAWTIEVSERMQKVKEDSGQFPNEYKKKHFMALQKVLEVRYGKAEECPINKKVLPLREKGKFGDPWNIYFMLSMVFLLLTALGGRIAVILVVLEFLSCIAFGLNILFCHRAKLIVMVLGWGCQIGKLMLGIFVYASEWYILLSMMQLLITFTYFLLSYQPQLKRVSIKDILCGLWQKLVQSILGNKAVELIEEENKRQN